MSQHLPDCFLSQPWNATTNPYICICNALLACEARLEDEWLNRYNAAEQRGYDAGFRNGALAARDAVAALPAPYGLTMGPYVVKRDALAAIDALKEKPSTTRP